MNLNDELNHPCLAHHKLVADICRPLQAYGVTFFGFTAVDTKGDAYCLGSKADYAEEYLRNNHVVDDAQYRPEFIKGQHHYHFWDFITLSKNAGRIYQLAADFDQSHTLTISRFDEDMTRCYHFSGQVADVGLNQRFLDNLDALHAFIDYFDHCTQTMPEISAIFQHSSQMQETSQFSQSAVTVVSGNPKKIILPDVAKTQLSFKNINDHYLTKKERECLYWLQRGKSAEMIADMFSVSRKTIERRISSVKSKYDCYTQFQLGQKVSEAGLDSILALNYRS